MKRTWAYALTLAVLLSGCGAKQDAPAPAPDTDAAPAQTALPEPVTDIQTASESGSETLAEELPEETAAQTETETSAAETADAPAASGSEKEAVIASYKAAIEDKIAVCRTIEDAGGNYSIDYALYDMDHNGTPELLLRYGTCEADYRIAVYTYRDGALVTLGDEIGGSHTSFGYDTKANQMVLIQGHMGAGDIVWYDLDENGALRELTNAGGFAFGAEGQPEFEDIMKKYNVSYLATSSSYSFGDEARTTIFDASGSYDTAEEYAELNYKLLEAYQF